jgi:hypothetical protein
MAVDTLVLGHSFVRRLGEYCQYNNITNMNLNPAAITIGIEGIGGLTVDRMYDALDGVVR